MRGGGFLEVVAGRPGGSGIVTSRDFGPGETIMEVAGGSESATATRFTLQLGIGRHIDVGEIRYLNHSCAPNTFFEAPTRRLIALDRIGTGDELTLFYPASEWDMACPFLCECAAPGCTGFVAGARYLEPETLAWFTLNDHIRRLAEAEGGR